MRGASRRSSDAVVVSLRNFAWPRPAIATLRHPTLPWFESFAPEVELSAIPIADLRNAGARDRLSLVGQFATHIALLQFAGIADGEFDANEWVVVRKRGSDCRLVRIAARECDADATPSPLHSTQHFAEAIHAPELETLKQSWTRAESIFAEVHGRLRSDAAADMRWLQRCAVGEILPPGAEAISAMWSSGGPHEIAGTDALDAFHLYAALDESARLIVIGSEFPIQRYAALASLDASLVGSTLSPAEVADRLSEVKSGQVLVVSGNLDDESRRVVEMIRRHEEQPAIVRRWTVLSTRLAAQRALEERLIALPDARAWLDAFTASDVYDKYLRDGAQPVDDGVFARTPEPRRSYIAALALLGTRIPSTLARDFLSEFLFEQPLDALIVDGVTSLEDDCFVFASEAVREHCARHVPEASRPALARAAASVTEKLEEIQWRSAEETVDALNALPRSTLTPRLASRLANALVDSGRYRDARDLAPLLAEDARELLLARCERRTGDYATALVHVEHLHGFDAEILRAELLRLTGRIDIARQVLERAEPHTDEEKMRLAYERAVLAIDEGERPIAVAGDHYLARRSATYSALMHGDFEAAADLAAQSFAAARSAAERIDSCLDRVFASFSSGRWSETRAIALEALAIVDEAQGDRAAAGILFTLTFVEADDGRWTSAAQHIARLRQYYANDALRLAEIDLLSGYLEFARGHFDEARRLVSTLFERKELMPQIREAAALVLDEIDWIEQRQASLRSTGKTQNRELDERHRLMHTRRGTPVDPLSGFAAALARWEASPQSEPPQPATRSEKLKLFRSSLGISRHDVARTIVSELSITMPEAAPARTTADVEMLRIAASAEYPFRADAFAIPWCHVTRNRLGQWSQDGLRSFDGATLDRIASSLEPDWLRCNEREMLFIEGSTAWPQASRDAIAALFRTRAENHRLRRILEQDEASAPSRRDSIEGIVGDSVAMREIFSLVERIAQRDVPVCILGESGTGKELVGRAIHRASSRRHKTFTAVNCAALPENLVESELFGHMRGAFTGADRDRAGLIETSDGGTLFLDEIGEMPHAAQAKLLRFLQDGEFRRVGDTTNRTADVRIVSATNRKLEAAVEEGRFREDLYYRVRGIEVVLPPLRERGEDVMLLAQYFLARERAKHRAGPQSFTPEVETLLQSYGWPGNVRELQNTVRAAHAMAGDAREIDIEHLPERLRKVRPVKVTAGSYQDAVARFRRDLIEKSLAAAAGNQNRAAALLKISRQALAYQIRELGIMVGKQAQRPRA
ncbi:MAG TPA: sigma 54-interacting transcriptional regulator [Thermoanaerobaculia bacterium]